MTLPMIGDKTTHGSLTDGNTQGFLTTVLAFAVLAFLFALVAAGGATMLLVRPSLISKGVSMGGFALSMVSSIIAFSVFAANYDMDAIEKKGKEVGVPTNVAYGAAFVFQIISFILALAGVATIALSKVEPAAQSQRGQNQPAAGFEAKV